MASMFAADHTFQYPVSSTYLDENIANTHRLPQVNALKAEIEGFVLAFQD